MSIHISQKVWQHTRATGNTLVVLLALADHANEHGFCWPGVPSLAKKCRISDRTVQRCIRELEELKEITVTLGKGGAYSRGHTNRYYINLGDVIDDTSTGDKSSNGPVTNAAGVVTTVSPKPSVESSEENINTNANGPPGETRSAVSFSDFPEKRPTPPVPVTPLEEQRLNNFCTAVTKLRKDFVGGGPVPPISPQQRLKIHEGLMAYHEYKVVELLKIFAAAWQHWDSIREKVRAGKYAKGFHAQYFWPPECGFKHLNKIEDCIWEEADADPAWWDSIIKDVKRALLDASSLPSEGSK